MMKFSNWFSTSPENQALSELARREAMINNAIEILNRLENDPQIVQIIQQLQGLLQQK